MRYVLGALFLLLFLAPAQSRDGWAGRPLVCDAKDMNAGQLEQCQSWIQAVRQPDNRQVSCCGDGDAYIADEFQTIGGNLFAVVTGDYQPLPGEEYQIVRQLKKGDKILIPPNKINKAREDGANPTTHGIVFISPGTGEVLCYFFPGPLT